MFRTFANKFYFRLNMEKRTKLFNIIKAILTRIVVIVHMILLYLSFFWQTDKILVCAWMLIGIMFICVECIYTIFMRQGQDFKWGSPMIFIYIVTAYLPCLVSYHVHDFNNKQLTCETVAFESPSGSSYNVSFFAFFNNFQSNSI
jgi:hypothetical protein